MNLKKDTLANTVGIFANMTSIWLMNIIIVRLAGYKYAGDFAIALSNANIFVSIASFSVRFYYSADTLHKFSDMQYFLSRFLTVLLSIIACLITIICMGYNFSVCLTIILFYLYKCVEMSSDILFGTMQRYEKLYYSGYSMLLKAIGSLVLFIVLLYFCKEINIALFVMLIYSIIILIIYDINISIHLSDKVIVRSQNDWQQTVQLLIICIPLFVVTLCYNFIPSIPRIIFERLYSERELGYYASISTITVLISTVISCVAIPIIPRLSNAFRQKDKWQLIKILFIMLLITFGIGLTGCVGTLLFGKELLVFLFGKEIEPYAYLMLSLIVASTLTAVISCLNNFFIASGWLKSLMFCSILGLLACIISVVPLCNMFYMKGLVYCLLLSQGIEIVFLFFFIIKMMGGLNGED